MESTHQEKYIKLKRFAVMILLLVALLTLAGCSVRITMHPLENVVGAED